MKTKPVYEAVYNAFADIYDEVMRDVDYASWARHIINLADRFEIQVDKILELACGTGSLAIHLAQLDFAITGIDRSEAMLHHAKEKSRQEGVSIPFHAASMQSFSSVSLDQDFDLILCLYDSLNYLLNEEDIHATFQEVTTHLRPGGAFIFDVT
ncbi:MAG: class I SAM-dependent methyltransferase, partial [bacterium]|nr:class I SAM-dependent methyltransferase [bacterium]